MATLLAQAGFRSVGRPSQADVLIVNTCGFIAAARDESINELRALAGKKKNGQLLIAAGCLTQRYGRQVVEQVPGLDGILGTRRWMDILDVVQKLQRGNGTTPLYHLPEAAVVGSDERGVPRVVMQGASAYLKIADGCRRPCAFCSIPLIKGTTVSRPIDIILHEAKLMEEAEVKELVLIAQDTTDYGYDIGIKDGLAKLTRRLVEVAPGIPWLRIMYAYPGYISDELIEVMATTPQVLHYLDLPLQHAHPDVLKRMQRPSNIDGVYRTIEKMRIAMPDLALRTTFIVGYPGETDTEFRALLDFIQAVKFDHVGVFTFSFEVGTASEPLGDPVSAGEKAERLERLMLVQESISLGCNQGWIGKTLPVLVEGRDQQLSVGRSYRDAPEIDGLVLVEGEAQVGEIVPVHITGALAHDLTGYLSS